MKNKNHHNGLLTLRRKGGPVVPVKPLMFLRRPRGALCKHTRGESACPRASVFASHGPGRVPVTATGILLPSPVRCPCYSSTSPSLSCSASVSSSQPPPPPGMTGVTQHSTTYSHILHNHFSQWQKRYRRRSHRVILLNAIPG